MDPITGLIISSLIGGGFSALGGANQQPTFQPKDPFTGSTDNPEQMLSMYAKQGGDLISQLQGNLAKGVSLPDAYVQTPDTQHVPGIPFPIGDSAHDPMSMMSLPGLGQGGTFGQPKTPVDRTQPGATTPNGTPVEDMPAQASQESPRVARRKGKSATDDSSDALDALRVLR